LIGAGGASGLGATIRTSIGRGAITRGDLGKTSRAGALAAGRAGTLTAFLPAVDGAGAAPAALDLSEPGLADPGLAAVGLAAASFAAAGFVAGPFAAGALVGAGFAAAGLGDAGLAAASFTAVGFAAGALVGAAASFVAAGFAAPGLADVGLAAASFTAPGFAAGALVSAGFAGGLAATPLTFLMSCSLAGDGLGVLPAPGLSAPALAATALLAVAGAADFLAIAGLVAFVSARVSARVLEVAALLVTLSSFRRKPSSWDHAPANQAPAMQSSHARTAGVERGRSGPVARTNKDLVPTMVCRHRPRPEFHVG